MNHLNNRLVILDVLHIHETSDAVSAVSLNKETSELLSVDTQRVFGCESLAELFKTIVDSSLVDYFHNCLSNKVGEVEA